MTLIAGTRLGPYEVLSTLGVGGMGEVYRARDTRLGREVAVKILPEDFARDPERLRRFQGEARAASALADPHIVAVFDVGDASGVHFFASELVEGHDLRHLLDAGPVPIKKALDLAEQIASGLVAAHEKGIVHRDLKPENILITKAGLAKIADFGLAKLVEPTRQSLSQLPTTDGHQTTAGVVMGTVSYMSPEQVEGRPVDARSDLFSLGVILFEMLSGSRPFQKPTSVETMAAILREEPPELSEKNKAVSPGLARIVRHCLEKDPSSRFQSARDIAFALEPLREISIASGAIASVRAARAAKARALLAAAAAAAVLAIAGTLLLGRRLGSNAPPTFNQVTYKSGAIGKARFAPDGRTILYDASWGTEPLQVFVKRPEGLDAVPVGPPGASLLSVSGSGEIALALGYESNGRGFLFSGTLARVPLTGGAPRELLEHVREADWSPDGSALAVVRDLEGKSRLEFPPGKVLYETRGHVSHPRFSPRGDLIAFFDHPSPTDTRGSVAVVSLSGEKRTLIRAPETAGLAWSPSGREVWFTGGRIFSGGEILGVTLSGKQRLIARAPGYLVLGDVFRDGRALVSRAAIRVSAFALGPGEKRERDLSWLQFSTPRVLSSDGKILLFDEQGDVGPNYETCLRPTDGSPVVHLGEGSAVALSPDGKWALSLLPPQDRGYTLLPTGAGETRQIVYQGIAQYRSAAFLPGGKDILFLGRRGQEPFRFFRGSLDGGTPSPATLPAISPPGDPLALSPDGRRLVALSEGVPAVFSLDDGPEARPHSIPGVTPADVPVQWSDDGRFLYFSQGTPDQPVAKVFRVEVETGRRTLWKEIVPSDPSGAVIKRVLLTPDAKFYAYGVERELMELYVVEGLK